MDKVDHAQSRTDLSKANPMLFEVVIDRASKAAAADNRCQQAPRVVVAVEAEGLFNALASTPDPAEATRRAAEELACQAAVQAIEKDLPAEAEPACSPSPINQLPSSSSMRWSRAPRT